MKKFIALFLALIMCVSFSTVAMAAETTSSKEKDVLSLAESYNVNVRIDEVKKDGQTYVSVDRAELIELLENISTAKGKVVNVPEIVIQPGAPTRGEGSYTFTEWIPLRYFSYLGTLFNITVWRNVQFDYNYSYPAGGVPKFTGYRNVTSWLSGVAVNGWTQVGSSVNFTTTTNPSDTAKVSVTGYAYIGIEYEGINLSIQMPTETWNYSLRLVPNES